MTVKEDVFKVMSGVFNIPVEQISEDSSPDTIRGWDSLKHMNLVLALEEEFGIQFAEEQIVEMLNVALLIEAIKEAMDRSKRNG